jgi:drug/metabolite transporter (DMT)-like permease
MRQRTDVAGAAYTGVGRATLDAVRRSVGTPPRRWLIATTLLLGGSAAAAVAAGLQPADRTFATIADPVQSLMSVTVPFLGRWRSARPRRRPGR